MGKQEYHEDNILVEQLRIGDRISQDHLLTQIYKNNYGMVEKYILENSGTKGQVPDIFQEGIIAFYIQCKKEDFFLKASLATYLYAICRNIWLSKLNREKRTNEFKENRDGTDYFSTNTKEFEQLEKNKTLSKIIDRLGGNCQKILVLFYFEKLPMISIADNMGFANKDVAKSKKYKCLQKLKTMVMASSNISTMLR